MIMSSPATRLNSCRRDFYQLRTSRWELSEPQPELRAGRPGVAHAGPLGRAEAAAEAEAALPGGGQVDGHGRRVAARRRAPRRADDDLRGRLGAPAPEIEVRRGGELDPRGHGVALVEAREARSDGA